MIEFIINSNLVSAKLFTTQLTLSAKIPRGYHCYDQNHLRLCVHRMPLLFKELFNLNCISTTKFCLTCKSWSLILRGDLNARHSSWLDSYLGYNGRKLHPWLTTYPATRPFVRSYPYDFLITSSINIIPSRNSILFFESVLRTSYHDTIILKIQLSDRTICPQPLTASDFKNTNGRLVNQTSKPYCSSSKHYSRKQKQEVSNILF